MSIEKMFAELRKESARVTFVPVDLGETFYEHKIPDAATINSVKHVADSCIICGTNIDHKPTDRVIMNVLKAREPSKYPWRKNSHLSHSRKVAALRAWRSKQYTWCQMSMPQALGRLLRGKTLPLHVEEGIVPSVVPVSIGFKPPG